MNADDDLYFAKGGAPDYQLVYFFWEKGKVETKERKTSFLCKNLKKSFSDKIGGKFNFSNINQYFLFYVIDLKISMSFKFSWSNKDIKKTKILKRRRIFFIFLGWIIYLPAMI